MSRTRRSSSHKTRRYLDFRRNRLRTALSCVSSARRHLIRAQAHALLEEISDAKRLGLHAAGEIATALFILRDTTRKGSSAL